MRRSATSRSRHAGRERFARRQIAEDHAPARQQLPGEGFGVTVSATAVAQQRPSARRRAADAPCRPALAAAALGIEQRAQILETIGRHQARGHQFPQRRLPLRWRAGRWRASDRRRRTRRAFRARPASRARDATAIRRGDALRRRQQPFAHPGAGTSRAAPTRVGRTRRRSILLVALERGMRARAGPTHLARQAKLIQLFRLVTWRCAAAGSPIPTPRPEIS